jgi:Muramidase (flagellum-specific)
MAELVAVDFDPFKKSSTPDDFSARYGAAAEKAGKALGVDPKVVLGQWGLETGWGKSVIPGTNNLGNIKDFSGKGTAATDNMTGSRDKYRAYESPDQFVDDYVSLIQRKYPNAVNAKTPEDFAKALKSGGYAEDPGYVSKVKTAAKMTPTKASGGVTLVPVDHDPFAAAPSPGETAAPEGGGAAFGVYPKARRDAKNNTVDAGGSLLKGVASGFADVGNTIINSGTKAAANAIPSQPNMLINPDVQRPPTGITNIVSGQSPMSPAEQQNAERAQGLKQFNEENKGAIFSGGRILGNIAATYPVGGAIAAPFQAAGGALATSAPMIGNALSKFGNAVATGGMSVGGAPATTAAQTAGNLLARAAGGAVTGGASAGLVDPETAKTGALIGGALPVATFAAGKIGQGIGRSIAGKPIAPEVKALADRAQQLGIDIPADRLVNSKPLNALAASLDYVPGSGRAGTMDKMTSQLNTALSKTFGQNSDNVTAALRKAQGDLGGKFDKVLQSNTVKVDQQFMTDLADAANMASRELGSDGAGIIGKQVDDILAKATTGEIDGQAAYNIKKTLDRISNRSTPEAFYARELKKKLMEALDRSLGSQEAAAFATVRKQYSNMLSLENLAQNGAEGNISIARLANMKNINNPELQELADISAQFLKAREGAHGAAQRVGAGALALGLTGPQGLAAGMATGRGANMLLNSSVMKNAVTGTPQSNRLLQFARSPEVEQLLYRSAPVAGSR